MEFKKLHDLPVTEEIDFHYLLTLMPVLKDVPEFSFLPELFTLIGYEKLIDLCKYTGGETIQIPTLEELSNSIDSLQWFYDVYIKQTKEVSQVPANLITEVMKIKEVYDVRNNQISNNS